MTNRKLRQALLQELDVTPQRLSQRVQQIKRKCPMTTEEATYCLAHLEGLRLDKFLPREAVDRVRGLLAHFPERTINDSVPASKTKTVTKTREVNIGGAVRIEDPVLSEKALNEATEMANKVYPLLYVFENSVREVIQRIMTKQHGANWWTLGCVPAELQTKVRTRRDKEDVEAWHGKRGAHPIFYTDIEDLKRIVQNNWSAFKKLFPRQDWFSNLVSCMEMSRNPVAHMNPLAKHDIDRVRINLRDWHEQITNRISLLTSV